MAMTTHAATAAPAMALAGTTPLSGDVGVCAPELIPFGAAAVTTAREEVGVGLVDRVAVAVAVALPVLVPVEVALGDASGVGASLGPDPDAVGVLVVDGDAT